MVRIGVFLYQTVVELSMTGILSSNELFVYFYMSERDHLLLLEDMLEAATKITKYTSGRVKPEKLLYFLLIQNNLLNLRHADTLADNGFVFVQQVDNRSAVNVI